MNHRSPTERETNNYDDPGLSFVRRLPCDSPNGPRRSRNKAALVATRQLNPTADLLSECTACQKKLRKNQQGQEEANQANRTLPGLPTQREAPRKPRRERKRGTR